MPIGSPNLFGVQSQASANVGTLTGSTAFAASATTTTSGSNAPSAQAMPIALGVLVALYLFWAVVIRHEKVNAQLSPANVAVNLHNIIVVGLTAMLFILLGQVLFIKLTILKVPGAATVARLFSAA